MAYADDYVPCRRMGCMGIGATIHSAGLPICWAPCASPSMLMWA